MLLQGGSLNVELASCGLLLGYFVGPPSFEFIKCYWKKDTKITKKMMYGAWG